MGAVLGPKLESKIIAKKMKKVKLFHNINHFLEINREKNSRERFFI